MNAIGIFLFIAIVAALGVAAVYNRLVSKRKMTDNGWADIDVQLKRRADLIPQLVATVKGYAAHERALFEDIAEKRSAAAAAGDDPAARGVAESALSRPVSRVIALAENYPDLKANQNFLDLQRALADTEDKIEMARRFYNGAVRELNTLVASVPANFIAAVFGFSERAYFEAKATDRAAPSAAFGS